jgi:hypothetical protein
MGYRRYCHSAPHKWPQKRGFWGEPEDFAKKYKKSTYYAASNSYIIQ